MRKGPSLVQDACGSGWTTMGIMERFPLKVIGTNVLCLTHGNLSPRSGACGAFVSDAIETQRPLILTMATARCLTALGRSYWA